MRSAMGLDGWKQSVRSQIGSTLTRYPVLRGRLLFLLPHILEHSLVSRPRYGSGQPPHPGLTALIEANRARYGELLTSFAAFAPDLHAIPVDAPAHDAGSPMWRNHFFSGLDAMALYGFLTTGNPRRYVEVGSGNSTRFARRAITDQGLRTTLTSIDPSPRVEIDRLCDRVVRQGVESVDLSLFDELEAGDILFVDNSHRVFMNSDACVVFMDILPRLKPGVLVHVHDVFLPYDYPAAWIGRYYSEQYLVGAALLAGAARWDVLLPIAFVAADRPLSALAAPLWEGEGMAEMREWLAPSSFWLRMR